MQQGFTLVELMVSLTIFSIVMLVSTGTLLIMIDVNAKAQAIYSSTTNLTFALDNMTREIRTGYHYYCGSDPGDGYSLRDTPRNCDSDDNANYITFTKEKNGDRVGYRLNEDGDRGVIEQKIEDGNWIPLTSVDVDVEGFTLIVNGTDPATGSGPTDSIQPTVDFTIFGYVNNGLEIDTEFSIQSHVVQRRLDLI